MTRIILYIAFFLSGAAGLVYEVVWSRYLALFVGHSAEAQVLVIGMFLGGLALGSSLVGRRSESIRRPLRAYALIEIAIAVVGISFHAAFELLTGSAYAVWFPALGSPLWIAALKWVVASLIIFLPATLLGATFPLMAAGATRVPASGSGQVVSGRVISGLYFVNSLGGAVFVLVAGFGLVPALGLPGALAVAAALNVAAAAGAALAERRADAPMAVAAPAGRPIGHAGSSILRPLLAVAALTAVASFAYQIAWIRMLSLVMGSATHSFELMLSAFILGLALGAWIIRKAADSDPRPLLTLGRIQWLMGLLALATLPVYTASFGWVGDLVAGLPKTEGGYRLFAIARYGIALAVMLPATVLAGMTLPLITTTLLRAGAGERVIGLVYGVNTAGAIAGVLLAGLIALPILGLKGLLIAGALLDMGLGVALLARAGSVESAAATAASGTTAGVSGATAAASATTAATTTRWRVPAGAAAVGVFAAGLAGAGLAMDRALLTSGVFRFGPSDPAAVDVLYYADGRTATVGVHQTGSDSLVVLTSNGKPDASLTRWWLRASTSTAAEPRRAIRQQDEATQMLAAIITCAHAPRARRAAVIGHGSGISGHFLLTAPELESLVTIEIEPRIVDASTIYYPANRLVFDDPRSRIAIADAKSFFAQGAGRYDLVLSEPSNPWVSGTASLFSVEFYRQVREQLTERGVFAQWLHLYEMSDGLIGSVLAALHDAFPAYTAYLVGDTDVMIVAGGAAAGEPDWSILDGGALRAEIAHLPPLRPDHLEGLKLFERRDLEPLFPGWSAPNSDYAPILDTGSERTRFLDEFADGVYGLARDRFQLAAALGGWRRSPGHSVEAPMPGLAPLRARTRAVAARAWLGDPAVALAGDARAAASTMRSSFASILDAPSDAASPRWGAWAAGFLAAERLLHQGTAGFADEAFYARVRGVLAGATPPDEITALVDFEHGLARWDFDLAAAASDVLVEVVAGGTDVGKRESPVAAAIRGRIDPAHLLDGTAAAWIRTGHTDRAAEAIERLAPLTGRPVDGFPLALLRSYIDRGDPASAAAGAGNPSPDVAAMSGASLPTGR